VPNDGDGDEGEARAVEEDSGGVDQAGRCVEVDTAVFYDERLADQARQVCARCPVKQPCLECALSVDRGYDFGMGWDDTKGDGIMRELHPLSGADPLWGKVSKTGIMPTIVVGLVIAVWVLIAVAIAIMTVVPQR
jgi:Transcription factor WhiB